tara:strand:- start:299 stop:1750 length:1452 start_codon:yes stop_codon:yes gene_type:complete
MKSYNYLLAIHDDKLYSSIISKLGNPKILIGYNSSFKKTTEYYNAVDLYYCRYKKDILNSLPPLDSEILEALEPYQINFLKICERLYKGSMCFEERLRFYYDHIRFWNFKLEQKKITHFIQYNVPHEGYDYLIYSLCKIKKIRTIFSYKLPVIKNILTKRYFIEDIHKHSRLYNENRLITSPEELETSFKNLYYSIYPNKNNLEESLKFKTFSRIAKPNQKNFFQEFDSLINSFRKYSIKSTLKKIIKRINFLHQFIYKNPYLISDKRLNKLYDNLVVNNIPSKPYIFFALHYQPELSTVPLGNNLSDLNLVVDLLAWAGKKYGFNILVKRHPRIDKRLFFRPKDIYKRMNLHHNVILLDTKTDVTQIIEKATAVASITGSTCWEAFLRKKPVLLFGSLIYENAPGTFKIESKEDLLKVMEKIINNQVKIDELDIINYLKFLEEHTFDNVYQNSFFAAPSHLSINKLRNNFVDNLEKFIKDQT